MLSLLDILRQEIEEAFAGVPFPPDNNWIIKPCFSAEEHDWCMELLHTRIINDKMLPVANEQEEQGWHMTMCFCTSELYNYLAPRLMQETLRDDFKLADGNDAFWIPLAFSSPRDRQSSFSVAQKNAACHWCEYAAALAVHRSNLACLSAGFVDIIETLSPQIPNYKPLFPPQPT